MRKHDVTKIHLKIDEVSAFHNEQHEGLCILWSSDIGFGEYNLYKTSMTKQIHGMEIRNVWIQMRIKNLLKN